MTSITREIEQERLDKLRKQQAAQAAHYKAAREAWVAETLTHDADGKAAELIDSIKACRATDAKNMVAMIRNASWLKHASADIRHLVLTEVDRRIIAIREGERLHPFDDPIWPEDAHTVWTTIKGLMT